MDKVFELYDISIYNKNRNDKLSHFLHIDGESRGDDSGIQIDSTEENI